MNCAGTEKSFLSFLSCLDFDKFDVTLVLAKKTGLLLDMLPPQVKVVLMEKYGDHFLISGKNAAKNLFNTFVKKNPFTLFELAPYVVRNTFANEAQHISIATKLWLHFMHKIPPVEGEYDVAVAYWGDWSMFFMCDKVKAKKKIAWLHFDYANPPRDDEIYLKYFRQCDKIVTVSKLVDDSLKNKLPEIADKCVMMENITNPEQLNELADIGETYPDKDYKGKRILTIGRIGEQKGLDLAVPAIKRLADEGYDFRWYVLGDGEADYKQMLNNLIKENGVEDRMVFLGTTQNPYAYLRNCDIYAQPSRHEGKPIAVEEAKIMARPIFASHYLRAPEQLDGERFGIIRDIGTDGIYDGIKALLDSPELCEKLTSTLKAQSFGNKDEIKKFYEMLG